MLICIKKVNENMEFREILNPSSEELKNIVGAKTLAAHKINDDITCLYDLDKEKTQDEYNFILLEEKKAEYEPRAIVKGTAIFIRDLGDCTPSALTEDDVSYLSINYLKNTAKDTLTGNRYDTLEIFA